MHGDNIGLLTIRAWVEEESSDPLRAHIRHTTDLSTGFDLAVTLTTPEAVGAPVQAWMRSVIAGATPTSRSPSALA